MACSLPQVFDVFLGPAFYHDKTNPHHYNRTHFILRWLTLAELNFDPFEHLKNIPHSKAIGMVCVEYDQAADACTLMIPYASHLVGDPDTGVIHGGAITALLDNAAGFVARPRPVTDESLSIATLDMRIDYITAAPPGKDIFAYANCFKRSKSVAFVRALAYVTSKDEPIATATATFMLGTRNVPFASASSEPKA